jgi:endonuclease YncB( thermonuclease family)
VSTSGNVVGRVTHVRDGDTIAVAGRPIRFANLDCAETGTLAGTRADRRMRALVSGKTLSCRLTGRKSYDRWIGFCRFPDGRDLASVMVKSGACTWWRG